MLNMYPRLWHTELPCTLRGGPWTWQWQDQSSLRVFHHSLEFPQGGGLEPEHGPGPETEIQRTEGRRVEGGGLVVLWLARDDSCTSSSLSSTSAASATVQTSTSPAQPKLSSIVHTKFFHVDTFPSSSLSTQIVTHHQWLFKLAVSIANSAIKYLQETQITGNEPSAENGATHCVYKCYQKSA